MDDKHMSFSEQFTLLELPMHGVRLPKFDISDEHKNRHGIKSQISNLDFLKLLCEESVVKYDLAAKDDYSKRLNHELEILEELGFIDYILLVWEVLDFCKTNNIPTGLGRGSAAGSLVLYLIGVTKIDPVKYDLYFERFVSKIRAKKKIVNGVTYLDGSLMADVDIDVCFYRRIEVLKYLEKKFKGKTAKILTLNTLSGKLLMKECGKIVSQKDESEMNFVTEKIPKVFGQVKDIEEAYAEVPAFKEWCDENKKVYKIAKKLRGLIKNKGVHASGMLLSFDELNESCPTELDSSKNETSSFDMEWVSLLNVKLDILGLRSVSVVDSVCKMINKKIEEINVNDSSIYIALQNLKYPHGLFQIEAETNFKVCQKVKPRSLEELSGVLALARPGALQFVDQYAKYTTSDTHETIHPFFDDILQKTGGVCLYQEQLMKMAHKIGFSLDEAEIIRRVVGKKKVDEVQSWKEKVFKKIQDNNLDEEIGNIFWKILEDSSNYSFNKSHSAAYAGLAAVTTYLKVNHPKEFFLALLQMTKHEPDPINEISKIERELKHFNIKLLPPDLMKSKLDFASEGEDIRFGLLSIKGVSDKSIEKILNFKRDYTNKFSAFEAAKTAGLSIGILSALIQAGAVNISNKSRSYTVYEAQLWNLLTEKEKKFCVNFGKEFEENIVKILKKLSDFTDEKGKKVIKESRLQTIKTKAEPYKKIYEQNNKNESFANWFYENKLLGYTYGKKLKDIFSEKRDGLMLLEDIGNLPDRMDVASVVTIMSCSLKKSKKGAEYIHIEAKDETALKRVLVFNSRKGDFAKSCIQLNNGLPEEGQICIITGQKKDDCIFAEIVAVQNNKIYTKLADLKE